MAENHQVNTFRDEILRWNRQINLVSRQETGDRLEGLLDQCRGGHEVLSLWMKQSGIQLGDKGLNYFDLGSGGGLPGVVWHILWSSEGIPMRSAMVEPREKRAWFLERVSRSAGVAPFAVMDCRWAEGVVPGLYNIVTACPTVISLKALHLDDAEVLAGLVAAGSRPDEGAEVVIARYYPPGQELDPELVGKLGLNPPGGAREAGSRSWRHREALILPVPVRTGPGASLVISVYEAGLPV